MQRTSSGDTKGTRARRINRAAALCCHVALTYGAAILRLENEARHANFEKALFQSVTKKFANVVFTSREFNLSKRLFEDSPGFGEPQRIFVRSA